MTAESDHHVQGGLGIAAGLAGAAGFVDAFVYLRVTPVFVANMSGNLIRFGVAAGETYEHGVAGAAIAIAAFVSGVMLATMHLDRRVRAGRALASGALLVVESLLLLGLLAIMAATDVRVAPEISGIRYVLVVVGAIAMGLQAVALRRVGDVAVSTTYGTGALVRLGEKVALALRRTPRPGETRRLVTIVVLGTVLVAYVSGAWFAAAFAGGPAWLLLPAAVPLVAARAISARPSG
jgi:uncharacterized membrane protein YoaK (UPF0700 family)